MKKFLTKQHFGFSLTEMIVTIFVLAALSLTTYSMLNYTLKLTKEKGVKEEALAMARREIENLHSIDYRQLGIINDPEMPCDPACTLQSTEIITQNNINYTITRLIKYFDDPADGTNAADTTGTNDYKKVSIKIEWPSTSTNNSVTLQTIFTPRNIEIANNIEKGENCAGGTLEVTVTDAVGNPLQNIPVYVDKLGSGSTPFESLTAANGVATLRCLEPDTANNYQIIVNKSGITNYNPAYSTAQTYKAESPNVNPDPINQNIIDGATTSIAFKIDKLSILNTKTNYQNIPHEWVVNRIPPNGDQFGSNINSLVNGGQAYHYFAWQDYSAYTSCSSYKNVTLFAQKYQTTDFPTTQPARMWNTNDVPIATTFAFSGSYNTTIDQSNGDLYVAWEQVPSGDCSKRQLNLKKINSSDGSSDGSSVWPTELIRRSGGGYFPIINLNNAQDHIYITFNSTSVVGLIYMNKYTTDNGTKKWTSDLPINTNGMQVNGLFSSKVTIIDPETNDLYVVWNTNNGYTNNIYAQKVIDQNDHGEFDPNWLTNIKINDNSDWEKTTGTAFDGITLASGQATPVLADLDGDGDKDMYIGGTDGFIEYYKNSGTPSSPAWTDSGKVQDGFTLEDIKKGDESIPTFIDIDYDNDNDMYIGYKDGKVEFYRNDGSNILPKWRRKGTIRGVLADSSFGNINVEQAAPQLVDIDRDGDRDLFIGGANGKIAYYRNDDIDINQGGSDNTINTPINSDGGIWKYVIDNYAGIQVEANSKPVFIDKDGDGDYDLYVGSKETSGGYIYYYENIGTKEIANWLNHGKVLDKNGVPLMEGISNGSSPAFADIDNDGDQDLIIGTEDGQLTYYKNHENNSQAINPTAALVNESGTKYLYVVWTDNRSGVDNIYLAKYRADNGQRATGWGKDLKLITNNPNNEKQSNADIAIDSLNNIYVTWGQQHILISSGGSSNEDIYLQKFNTTGITQWTDNLQVNSDSTTNSQHSQYNPKITINNRNEIVIAWNDYDANYNIKAAKIVDPNTLIATGIPLRIHGTKTKGKDISNNPIYKFDQNFSTDSPDGKFNFDGSNVNQPKLEFDDYSFNITSGSEILISSQPGIPITIAPDTSNNLTLLLAPNQILPIINDLTANGENRKVILVWTPTGAPSYNIYRKIAAGSYALLTNTTDTYSTYTNTGLTNGTQYCYKVRSKNTSGVESADSNEACDIPN